MLQGFDNREGKIWLNGKLVEWNDSKIHVLNHGLHYASSVFEGERAYNGKIFKSEEHTQRFFEGAQTMDMEIPFTQSEILNAKKELIISNGLKDAYVRPIAWRGSEMMAVSAQKTTINVAIASWAWPSYFDPSEKMKGIKLDIAKWRRPDPNCAPVHVKASGLYMICTLSKHDAEAKGYSDAVMLDWRDLIAEATGANIFFKFKDGNLYTPKPDCFLDGITRRTVIKLAKDLGVNTIEKQLRLDDIHDAEECFLTGTAAEVTPVSQIGENIKFTPGELSFNLMKAYEKVVNSQ